MHRKEILKSYQEHVLEHGAPPASVYAFSKHLEITEREFFEEFGSFETLESAIWEKAVKKTLKSITNGEEWETFNAQQRLLTFYYTFCDQMLDHRSFFLARFPRLKKEKPEFPANLDQMRTAFTKFADTILETGKDRGEIASRGPLSRTYPLGLFGHFLSVIEFNLSDSSTKFERTDAYIEKSVKLAFDVIGTQAVDSAFDLFRFLGGRSMDK